VGRHAGAVLQAVLAGYVDEHVFEAEVTTPEGVQFFQGLTDLIVKNTKYYAGAWVFDPTASPEDGAMELVPLRGRQELVARAVMHHELVPSYELPPNPLLKLSPITRATSFHIRILDRPLSAPMEAQVDGEEFPAAASYRIEVVRHALRLVVPSAQAAADAPEDEPTP
jgi:diacylglycerol kinase family enzyme